MREKWGIGHTLALAGVIVAIISIVTAVLHPELREKLGLPEQPRINGSFQSPEIPPQATPTPEPQPTPFQIFLPKSISSLRNANHVELIPEMESGETLAQIPQGSFGYMLAASIVRRNRAIRDRRGHQSTAPIRVDRVKNPDNFEIHKLDDHNVIIVGYVGLETFERARNGLETGDKLSLYTTPRKIAPSLIGIMLSHLRCTDARGIVASPDPKIRHYYVVDCIVQ
jgi:hypothetical protein